MPESPKNPVLIAEMAADGELAELRDRLFTKSCDYRYSYNFTWLGRPIIQYPEDVVALQEIVWRVRPDLIVETGIAHGGSLVLSASLLELLGGEGLVLGVDIEIRDHNRRALDEHPLRRRIELVEGSSTDPKAFRRVEETAAGRQTVMVLLDSSHTHEHVLAELELYSRLVTPGSYLVVFDTVVERMPDRLSDDRPWGRGNNPATAVAEFLAGDDRFEVDPELAGKLLLTAAPGGYLRCVR